MFPFHIDQLDADGLLEYAKSSLVSIVTDGANSMIGHKAGFGPLTGAKLGRPDLQLGRPALIFHHWYL